MISAPEYFNFAHDVFDHWARRSPHAPALWWVESRSGQELRLSYRQLRDRSLHAAQRLRQSGLRKGDRVVVLLPRIPDWWVAMLGLIRLGAVPVPCTPLLTVHDLAYRVEAARVRGVITDAEGGKKLDGFTGIKWQTGEADPGWNQFDFAWQEHTARFKHEPTRSVDPGILYFTSATTGAPKMVLHTQASYGLAHRITGEHWLDLRPDDVHWNIADVGWGKAAWSSFYGPWHRGACVFVLETGGRFDPGITLETLARYPISTCCAPPTALRMIVRHDLAPYRFPHLRHCVTAGEPLNVEVLEKWRAATGLTLHEAYGQTETVVLIGNFRSQGRPVRPGSMGRVAPGFDVAILDDALQPLPAGLEGEIAVRVAPDRPLGLFQEYWLNPEETARQFRGQWYLTGDRASKDPDGYFHFVGRKDDVIKSSGYRIGPGEVESALMSHRAVLDAAVIGRPDDLRGQIVKAFVLLRPEVAGDDLLKTDLKRHCKELVAPYKYPREIEFVSELPKTISGKTRRVELRQRDSLPRPPQLAPQPCA